MWVGLLLVGGGLGLQRECLPFALLADPLFQYHTDNETELKLTKCACCLLSPAHPPNLPCQQNPEAYKVREDVARLQRRIKSGEKELAELQRKAEEAEARVAGLQEQLEALEDAQVCGGGLGWEGNCCLSRKGEVGRCRAPAA